MSDSTVENGCLRVIPCSHAAQRIGEHVFQDRDDLTVRRELATEEFDARLASDVKLKAGRMVLCDVYTVHGADHNRGRLPRASYAVRFMPATSHFDHDAAGFHGKPGYAHRAVQHHQLDGPADPQRAALENCQQATTAYR